MEATRATLARYSLQRAVAREALADAKAEQTAAADLAADLVAAQAIAQTAAAAVQRQAHDQIARVVSRCLAAVFDDPYTFTITFERKRGRTEARLGLRRGDLETDPRDGVGGGVVDVAAFALRVAALVLSRPARRRLIVLDEPFKWVSAEYRPRLRLMLETLADELAVQFVIVTHFADLQIGKVIEIHGNP